MSPQAFQPYKLPILTSQLHSAHRATPRYGVTALPDLSTEARYLTFSISTNFQIERQGGCSVCHQSAICQYARCRSASRSATWSTNMSSNNRHVKLPFLTTRCHNWGGRSAREVDLPPGLPKLSVSASVKLPIFYCLVLTVEMWNCHSYALTDLGGRSTKFGVMVCKASMLNCWGVDLGGRSTKFGVMVCKASMLNCWGVDLPADLPHLV